MSEWRQGACHCRAVRFDVRGTPSHILLCNCSICAMKGYLHWIVSEDEFRLLTPRSALSCYQFGTNTAKHYFCSTCGVAAFYIARSHPDSFDVNARCVEGLDLSRIEVRPFDGQNWDAAYDRLSP